jgi:hypothetical protein
MPFCNRCIGVIRSILIGAGTLSTTALDINTFVLSDKVTIFSLLLVSGTILAGRYSTLSSGFSSRDIFFGGNGMGAQAARTVIRINAANIVRWSEIISDLYSI